MPLTVRVAVATSCTLKTKASPPVSTSNDAAADAGAAEAATSAAAAAAAARAPPSPTSLPPPPPPPPPPLPLLRTIPVAPLVATLLRAAAGDQSGLLPLAEEERCSKPSTHSSTYLHRLRRGEGGGNARRNGTFRHDPHAIFTMLRPNVASI